MSEFAARCPDCGRSAGDAREIDEPAAGGRAGPRPGTVPPAQRGARPADEELQARRRRLRGLMALALAAAVAGLWLALRSPTGGAPGSETAWLVHALPGRIASQTADGTVVLSNPDGSRPRTLTRFPLPEGSEDRELLAAADDRFLISGTEALIVAGAGESAPIDTNVLFRPGMVPAGPEPFADSDRAVVVFAGRSPAGDSPLAAVLLAGGGVAALGTADQASGDPRGVGAFVAVAAPAPAGRDEPGTGPADTRVELRRPGASVTLATSASLNRQLGQDPTLPVTLRVVPDAAGDRLAVVVQPVGGHRADSAVVVLDRRGRSLGVLGADSGPARATMPSWSPDGSELAFSTETRRGTAIAVWPVGGRVRRLAPPRPGARFDTCLWAPDGSTILCPESGSPRWILGRAGGGPFVTVRAPRIGRGAPLRPVAWLPGSS